MVDLGSDVVNFIIVCRCNSLVTAEHDFCPNCGIDLLMLAMADPERVKKSEK